MSIYTLILFDDDGVISHMEHFSERPTFRPEANNYAIYHGHLNGGDTTCIESHEEN